MDNEIIKQNEKNTPELEVLRKVVTDETEPFPKRYWAAALYVAIVLNLAEKRKCEKLP